MRGAITRILFVCAVALIVVQAASAARGEYQKTRDGRTSVWNNDPRPGDEAAWSGGRDHEGYAKGFGTLSWYTIQTKTSSAAGPTLYARYYGNMVRGKFDGPVNVHVKRKTSHALFVNGARTTHWIAGRAPARAVMERRIEMANREQEQEEESPAEGPMQSRARQRAPLVPPLEEGIHESLRELVGPVSLLRPRGNVHLTKEQAIDLADREARARGFNPAEYDRTEAQYNAVDRIWTINYHHPAHDETEKSRHFTVTIDDQTRGIVFVPGKE